MPITCTINLDDICASDYATETYDICVPIGPMGTIADLREAVDREHPRIHRKITKMRTASVETGQIVIGRHSRMHSIPMSRNPIFAK